MEIVKSFNRDDLVEICYANKRDQVEQLATLGVYYEDPIFSNKLMDFKEIKKKNRPVLNYLGFNFSSDQFKDFIKINSTGVESKIFESIKSIMTMKEKYYIISYIKGDKNTFDHEIAHYEFWKDEKIQDKIEKISNQREYNSLFKNMEKLGYHEKIINTEVYAFSKVIDQTLPIMIKKDLMNVRKILF